MAPTATHPADTDALPADAASLFPMTLPRRDGDCCSTSRPRRLLLNFGTTATAAQSARRNAFYGSRRRGEYPPVPPISTGPHEYVRTASPVGSAGMQPPTAGGRACAGSAGATALVHAAPPLGRVAPLPPAVPGRGVAVPRPLRWSTSCAATRPPHRTRYHGGRGGGPEPPNGPPSPRGILKTHLRCRRVRRAPPLRGEDWPLRGRTNRTSNREANEYRPRFTA
jgi:hypothetical protein